MICCAIVASGQGFGAAKPAPTGKPTKPRGGGQKPKKVSRACPFHRHRVDPPHPLTLPSSQRPSVQKALELIDRAKGAAADTSSPTSGRVEYVRVRDWGSGRAEDLGELEVAAPPQIYAPGGSLYEFLARQIEALQAEGALEVARPAGAPPPPPFERWAFAEAHYAQYLADLGAVHAGVEEALAALAGAAPGTPAARCHDLLGPAGELARAGTLVADLAQLRATSAAPEGLPTEPTPNAAAYAAALRRRGTACARAEDAAELDAEALKLGAHAYAATLTLLTSGARIGAAATERLSLFARQAVRTFKEYPEGMADPPLTVFRSAVDALGAGLDLGGQDVLLAELPAAMQRTAVLLEALAREA